MVIAELLFALVIALVLVAIFTYGFGRAGPWGGFLWFFVLVFLGAWAIGAWVEPVGPVAWGVAWVPIFFGALLIGLLVAAIPPAEPRPVTGTDAEESAAAAGAVGALFWLLLLLLIMIVALSWVF